MLSPASLLSLAHVIGLAMAVGAAAVKLALLRRCNADSAFVPVYLGVARPITRLIILGLILLTLSGIGWLVLGYKLKPLLVVKLVLVAAIWILGPVTDNVVEPAFQKLAPARGESPSRAFLRIQKQYLAHETVATGLLYVVILILDLVRVRRAGCASSDICRTPGTRGCRAVRVDSS